MLNFDTPIGSTTQGTTFPDIIINCISGIADNRIAGFGSFVHDPRSLKETVSLYSRAAIPQKFADAVILRRVQTQKLDEIWRFPLNMSCPTTTPLPWTIVESTVKSESKFAYEFNIMRTVDFIGRNYLKIRLPKIDCTEITDATVKSNSASIPLMSDPEHMYLGAWQRDLIPRLISKVSFYPKSNSHILFEYTGYDVYIHNILFGNAHKEMNDLLAGEDKFELCYDPYYVNGAALGLSSYKGIDAYQNFSVFSPQTANGGFQQYTAQSTVSGMTDNLTDYFQIDDTMDSSEFKEFYRKGVWFEPPVARNYHARHSIHSRRMVHQAKDLIIPLDILPFGYSIASSLPTTSMSSESGFIKVTFNSDWLDRSFYLTKVSDVPALYPIVNHTHYKVGDTTPDGDVIVEADPRVDWVNERAIGRFGDPEFDSKAKITDEGFETKVKFTQPGNIVGSSAGHHLIEGVVPTKIDFEGTDASDESKAPGLYRNTKYAHGIAAKGHAKITTKNNWVNAKTKLSTANDSSAIAATQGLLEDETMFIYKMSDIDRTLFTDLTSQLGVKLLQVGYYSLPCIREMLTKLPNIYITTEWKDEEIPVNTRDFRINNDLYITAIILWFIPTESNGVESLRMYPHHLVNHELPPIAGLQLCNEQNQGTILYDYQQLNELNVAQMGLPNPLLENMGIISFSPSLTSNSLPFAYYDSNICGVLQGTFKAGEGETNIGTLMNLKSGYCRCICIGVNGAALVNFTLFRLIF